MKPVAKGWCQYESLKDGTLSMNDIALMNDALVVEEVNMERAQKYYDNQHKQ